MPATVVRVSTPSRLHFGMLSFGQSGVRQFGGVGLMIDEPGIRLKITRADRLECVGPLAERAEKFARRIIAGISDTVQGATGQRSAADPLDRGYPAASGRDGAGGAIGVRIEIESAPREHVGLGTGTQLGLAVAAGIKAIFGDFGRLPLELARLAGRAERSSIGTHGFAAGGLLVEAGKFVRDVAGLQTEPHSTTEGLPSAPGDLRSAPCHGRETMTQHEFSPLIARIELPADWRFLLLIPKTAKGLFGHEEREAFARIPPVPLSVTDTLSREVLMNLLPAAIEADFTEFGRSLYRYGHIAGECFASQQHGAFLDRRTAELVDAIRSLGGEGVGQSSWGPTVFAAVAGQDAGHELAARLNSAHDLSDYDMLVARPNNSGAQIETDHTA
jgi:beta-ribofuranosylaminobenzene 5'-phosphate synthase